jgi:hypothetical protein
MPNTPAEQRSPYPRLETSADVYLSARQVCQRYGGVSDMTVWRWSHDPSMKFPVPLRIQKRRYWRLAALVAWEDARGTAQ